MDIYFFTENQEVVEKVEKSIAEGTAGFTFTPFIESVFNYDDLSTGAAHLHHLVSLRAWFDSEWFRHQGLLEDQVNLSCLRSGDGRH